ncbi:DUF397 domain-containing protein [Streptomyces sp. SID5998]|nr:DUF397 domain-containing protein [Streptomyces sp. SID5998]
MQLHPGNGEFTVGGRPVEKSTGTPRQGLVRRGVVWWKSSYSNPEGACVEVARPSASKALIRDSKVIGGPVVQVSRAATAAFTSAVSRGDL